MVCLNICTETLKKTAKNLSRYSQCHNRDSKGAPLEYKSKALTFEPAFSVYILEINRCSIRPLGSRRNRRPLLLLITDKLEITILYLRAYIHLVLRLMMTYISS
jgi:hypothetical protein